MASKCKYKGGPGNAILGTDGGLLEGFLDSDAQANYDSKSVQAAVRRGSY